LKRIEKEAKKKEAQAKSDLNKGKADKDEGSPLVNKKDG
jgi:hypothetical protein